MKLLALVTLLAVGIQVVLGDSLPVTFASAAAVKDPLDIDSPTVLHASPPLAKQKRRHELFKFISATLDSVARNILAQNDFLFTSLLNDMDQLNSSMTFDYKDNLQKYLSELRLYQVSLKRNVMETAQVYNTLGDILAKFEIDQSPEMQEFLENHVFPEFFSKIKNIFEFYFAEFSKRFQEFLNGLSLLDKQIDMNLLQSYDRYENERDFPNKLKAYAKLLIAFLQK